MGASETAGSAARAPIRPRPAVVSEEAHTDAELAQLSEARAAAVLQALSDRGVFAPRIETSFHEVNANAASAEVPVEPMARRVDVSLDVKPVYGL